MVSNPAHNNLLQPSKLMSLEQRVAQMESIIGAPSILHNLPILDQGNHTDAQTPRLEANLSTLLHSLQSQVALLDKRRLESIQRKMKSMLGDFEILSHNKAFLLLFDGYFVDNILLTSGYISRIGRWQDW